MKQRVRLAILTMGFSGLVAEMLLLRELLIVFSGNELGIGIILANWLVLEALGCFFPGRWVEKVKHKLEAFIAITVLFSLSLLAAVFLTRILKGLLGVSVGESIGFLAMFYASLLILLPVSMLHGALFTFSCRIYALYSEQDAAAAGKVYVIETLGTIAGGVVFTYLFIPYLTAFQAAIGLAMLNLAVGLVLLAPYRKTGLPQKTTLIFLSALIVLAGYGLFTNQADRLHRGSIQAQWRHQNVVHYENSPYGNICVLENQGQYIFFLDGLPAIITPIPDILFVEEFVHLPLLTHPDPRSILILSGGAGGIINEALKHASIESIEYAELDPLLLSLLRKFPTPLTESELNDARVKISHIDGRLLLRTTPNTYDLIFIGILEPSNLQANRFFTQEFYALAEARLNEGGMLVLGAPGSLTLLNEELRDLNSCIFHTLNSVFPHIRVIPGEGSNIFLASHAGEIGAVDMVQIVSRLGQRQIAADMMVPWYIENKLHHGWQGWFATLIEGGSRQVNRDLRPVGLFYSLSHWNALFAPGFGRLFRQFESITLGTLGLACVALLLIYGLLRLRNINFESASVPFAISTTGFAGMIFSLVVIFSFQSSYGYVFSWIGLLVAAFMAGTASGATLITRRLPRLAHGFGLFLKIELAIIGLSFGLPFVFSAGSAVVRHQSALGLFRMLFLVVPFACGLLTGSQFPLANELYLKSSSSVSKTAGLLYAADLLGGWLGGIVGAVVLLPVLGLAGTCITVGMLKWVSFIVLSTQPHSVSIRR
jgi:spermidine synthase